MDPEKTKIYTAVLIASIILAVVLGYFIASLIRYQRRFVSATKKNVLAELSVLEKDRIRIAADLHDELFPVLTAIKFQVDSVDALREDDTLALQTAKAQIDQLSARMREIANDLMPASLTRKGLAEALQEFFKIMGKAYNLRIAFTHHISSEIPEDKRINCYRIIQEITHNTAKHAKASTLLVRLHQQGNTMEVLCEDNGVGFDYDKAIAASTGLGLRNIRSRAMMISDNFTVYSMPGKGTQYRFDIHLNATG
jgi:two-component system, NarL family, sensor kinase